MSGSGMFGMGKSESSSSSRPLTAEERTAIYNAGQDNINTSIEANNTPAYTKATYNSLSGGNYDRLEEKALESQTAGIDRAKYIDSQKVDSDLAKRGIWSSGLAVAAQGDNNERYAADYLKAGADAATMRYGMEATDLANKNTFDAGQNNNEYQASWAPLNYFKDLWNNSSGVKSDSSSSGWNMQSSGGGGAIGGAK